MKLLCRPRPLTTLIAALAVLLGTSGASWAQNSISLEDLNRQWRKAYDQKRYVEAGALGLYAISRGERQSTSLYNFACSLSLAGDGEQAFRVLDLALKNGFDDVNLLKNDSDFKSIRPDVRWTPLVARIEKIAAKRAVALADPNRSAFITSDIPRFWRAYDLAMKAPQDKWAEILQREYFDRGSEGMKDWVRVRSADAKGLAKYIAENPKFYAAIRPATLNIAPQRTKTLEAFKKFKSLYPAAQFPGVVFSIGAFYGGGTVSNRNLLMSAEMYTASPEVPSDELGAWQKTVLTPTNDLPYIITHEMIHFQQRYPDSDGTLLRACIQEGSANFLGEMASGSVGAFHQVHVYPWADAHEKEIWDRFQLDMGRFDKRSVWLYSGSGEGKRPDDLGYYIGHRICEAYYKNAPDKAKAISDILNITDFKAFLKASRYAEKFK